jgi:hypothetical protein
LEVPEAWEDEDTLAKGSVREQGAIRATARGKTMVQKTRGEKDAT